MVQLAVAGDVAEAEELKQLLRNAGIESQLEAQGDDDPLVVMVDEGELDAAKDAIEALTEPDEIA
jgi:hypothetical protein